jgi:hypothetical protein
MRWQISSMSSPSYASAQAQNTLRGPSTSTCPPVGVSWLSSHCYSDLGSYCYIDELESHFWP